MQVNLRTQLSHSQTCARIFATLDAMEYSNGIRVKDNILSGLCKSSAGRKVDSEIFMVGGRSRNKKFNNRTEDKGASVT